MIPMPTDSVKNSLLFAFRYLLKPLVRMAVKNGVSFPEFSKALKFAFVDVAKRQMKIAGSDVTAEGICMITSIDAAEVEPILKMAATFSTDLDTQADNPLAMVLNAWHTDVLYSGPYGVLRDLYFIPTPAAGKREGPSFSELVGTYCPGVSPKVLLDELIRTGCVVSVGTGVYRAITRSYIPEPLSNESIRLVSQVVHNLCETLEVNLRPESRGGKGLVQRTIYSPTGLSPEAFGRFGTYARKRGQIFADEVDDWLTSNQIKEDSTETGPRIRTGIGFYQYVVNDEDEADFLEH
jgi:Family of unknown function (DUF6502)